MRAFVLRAEATGVHTSVEDITSDAPGDVLIDVDYSAMNFKDHLVAAPDSKVRRAQQLVLGVEASGRVVSSTSDRFVVGDEVIAYGGTIGVGHDGGFATSLRAPAKYVTKLPRSFVFHTRQAMIFGLAGYTAMASVLALESAGLTAGEGDVLVTGASGGVGSLAVTLLHRRGHNVVASTGSEQHEEWLRELGASEVIGRDALADRPDRVLASERWAGAVDCVGGSTLVNILRSLRYGAAVAASGLVAGAELTTTVYPFITRNVSLLGIDAVETPPARRDEVWAEICALAQGSDESLVERELTLEQLPEGLAALRDGATRGRWLVRPGAS